MRAAEAPTPSRARRASTRVVVADYGAGNVRSVVSAFARAGAEPTVTTDPTAIGDASLAVIAGVGNAARAARGLERTGLADALRLRAAGARPTLGICVGLQLLFEESEEGGRGLGLLAGTVARVRAPLVPHMGWNTLRLTRATSLLVGLDDADVYFAHSYAASPDEASVVTATTEHGGPIVAAVGHEALAGVQFHPERSGGAGARMLANALRWSRSA